ncbi:glycosyl hydrolase family 28-related protein [Phenylobacterium terrae]|uniref:Glycosyl hydrolase family 28-related protein n=1 Tax=Phenylobacterium terrae TaxID=2665495 RepID=A0ABW4N0H0_9CAUL
MATYNVMDFGAVGNGLVNDRAAIQAALDKAYQDGGGVVYIPAGVYAIDGGAATRTYAGLQVRDNVTIIGDGMGETIIKAMDGNTVGFTGLIRTPVGEETHNVTIKDLTLDGNRANTSGKVDGFFCGTEPGSPEKCYDITLLNVEAMNCSGYGIDPHEQTVRMWIENCVSHGNGLDGFTLDFLIDSTIKNNVSYGNDRHGFNVVTQTHNTVLEGNIAYDNGSSGIVIQRGSENVPSPQGITIKGGAIYGNLDGILVKMSHDIIIDGVHVYENDREGIKVYGSRDVTITGSTIENNSQLGSNLYAEIYLNQYVDDLTSSTFWVSDVTITNNTIGSTNASYGIREAVEVVGSHIDGNVFEGSFVRAQTLTGPQVRVEMPDLVAPSDDFYFQIPNAAYVDIDSGDAVSLSLKLVDANGQPVGGGALPSWLSFDTVRKMIVGDPPSEGTFWLQVEAKDKSGNTEVDLFKLTVSDSGTPNVTLGAPPPPPAPGTYNVKDYGAVGDGVANDRAAIQAAVDAAAQNGGGIVYLPAGTYGIGNDGLGKTYAGIQLTDGVTLKGAGMGVSTIKVLDGANIDITGVVRTPFNVPTTQVKMEDFTIDGNRANTTGKVDGIFVGTAPGSTQRDSDITISRVEVKNASGYGFDPHEQTIRLTIEDSVAHHNGLDGFTLDFLIDSTIRNNVSYANDRHGFNVVTTTQNTVLQNNQAYDNGGNGITVQRGSELIASPFDITITGGEVYGNALAGVLVKYSHDVTIDGVNIHNNGREGVKIDGSDNVSVLNSTIANNSQAGSDLYSEIYVTPSLDPTSNTTLIPEGFEISGNTISTTNGSWLIREHAAASGGIVSNNTLNGVGTDGVSRTGPQLRQATPDLVAPVSAFHYIVPQTAIVDVDPGDALTLSLQLVNASGEPVNGGTLPAWLTFNPSTWTLNGTPTTAQTIYLKLVAQDASGDQTSDVFQLTVAASGPYNVQSGAGQGPPVDPGAGTAGDDSLLGGAGNDTLNGLGGKDTLDGAAGADRLVGGDGDDVYYVDNAGDVVVEADNLGAGGVDTVYASVSLTLWDNVENAILTGTADLSVTGNGKGNHLTGNGGANLIDGGLGSDTMQGGAGDDTYVVNVTSDVVIEGAGAGIDTVRSAASYILGANLEKLVLLDGAVNGTGNGLDNELTGNAAANRLTGDAGNDTLFGMEGDDSLVGGQGADSLVGGAGLDTMAGGDGDDVYRIDDVGDVVNEADNVGAGGVDRVETTVSIAALWNEVENVVLLGSANLNVTGNSGFNRIVGNAGNNVLDGGGGDDTLIGGLGDDTYVVNVTKDVVEELAGGGNDTVRSSVSYTLGANVENLVLTGAALLGTGNELANRIIGNELANKLSGEAGADRLEGGLGDDSLSGGADADALLGGDGADTILGGDGHDNVWGGHGGDKLDGGAGFDYVRFDDQAYAGFTASLANPALNTGPAAGDTYVGFEGLILGSGNDYGFGDAGDNYIYGMGGHDQLFGGAGADYLHGGAGFDYARYDDQAYAGFTASLANPAVNTGVAAGDVYVEIEGLILGSGNDVAYGDAGANYIYGMGGADQLFGGAGGDYLHGGAGFDYARYDDTSVGVTASLANSAANAGGAAGDVFVEIEGLILSNGADSGQGDSGANYLYGMMGNDTLDGGAGQDHLHGGPGADRFVFSNAAHSTAAAPDRILDFTPGGGDIIDVSMVDANVGVAGDQAFAWVTSFTNTAGQVRAVYDAGQNRTVLEFDTDGDGQGDDMVIHVVGQVTSSAGFVL